MMLALLLRKKSGLASETFSLIAEIRAQKKSCFTALVSPNHQRVQAGRW